MHNPSVGIDIEAIDNVLKTRGFFENSESDVGAPVPLDAAVFPTTVVGEAGEDDGAFGEQPGGNVLGQDDLDPSGKVQALHEKS